MFWVNSLHYLCGYFNLLCMKVRCKFDSEKKRKPQKCSVICWSERLVFLVLYDLVHILPAA